MRQIESTQLIAFISFILAVSMTHLLQFLGTVISQLNRISRPRTIIVWTVILILCHAHYWALIASQLPKLVPQTTFYFEVLYPSALALATSILVYRDFSSAGPIDLQDHYSHAALPFFLTIIAAIAIGFVEMCFVLKLDLVFSVTNLIRICGIVTCLVLVVLRKRPLLSLIGAALCLGLYVWFIVESHSIDPHVPATLP